MLAAGELGKSYREGIKPKLLAGLPKFKYGTLIEDKGKPEGETISYKGGLDKIPARLINTAAGHSERLLRRYQNLHNRQTLRQAEPSARKTHNA